MGDIDINLATDFPAQRASFASMRNVMAKNRAAWLELFADDAVLQDPVGISPLDPGGLGHRGRSGLAAFWDSTIVGNKGSLRVRESYPCADECANVLTLTQPLPNGKALDFNLVSVCRVDDAGKIVSLKAYWQFDKLMERMAELMAD